MVDNPIVMASLADLPLRYRLAMHAYRHRRVEWTPAAVLDKPLSQARIAVVTSAAFHLPDQPAFDESLRGGDVSFRLIAAAAPLDRLRIAHRSDAFDYGGIEWDKNVALPLDRLHELVLDRWIGAVAPHHVSFMGSIPAPGRLVRDTAPEVAQLLQDDSVDGVLLTPV